MDTQSINTRFPLRIIIAGGSGSLGRALIKYLPFDQASFVVLSRNKSDVIPGANVVYWDGKEAGPWCKELEGADVLINLCGKSVDCRYTEKNKAAILDSRIQPTRLLGKAIMDAKTPPKLWINASSATYYRHSEDLDMDEDTGERGDGFSVGICRKWEEAVDQYSSASTRKIILRISMVLGQDHGVLPVLVGLAKKGLGGAMGNGRQYMSWIHEKDFAGIIAGAIQNESWSGVFNCTAPNPCTNNEFMQLIRKAAHARFHFRSRAWMLKIGAFFLRTETELVLKSRKVVPGRLLKKGYVFQYPMIAQAIADRTR